MDGGWGMGVGKGEGVLRISWVSVFWVREKRREYVGLYKRKLEAVQQGQAMEVEVVGRLERMEEEVGVEDLLEFRSRAVAEMAEQVREGEGRS